MGAFDILGAIPEVINQKGGLPYVAGQFRNDLSGTTANNDFNSAEAEKNRRWEEYMSNSAYQRSVADMKAAGINPASVGGQAAGLSPASTPSAQAAHATPNSYQGSTIGSFIKNAALIALSKGLTAKFTHAAELAAAKGDLVAAKIKHMAEQEVTSGFKAEMQYKRLELLEDMQPLKKDAMFAKSFRDKYSGLIKQKIFRNMK